MTSLTSPFRSATGEAEYLAAYEATMRLWPVQYESLDISSRFGSTHLVVCGPTDAPPLVLLHCFFTSLTIWAHNIADLSRDYRVYAPDMMGQPSRSIPDQPVRNRKEMAEWVTGVVDGLGLRRFDLAGYSYGGFAALNYSIYAQDRHPVATVERAQRLMPNIQTQLIPQAGHDLPVSQPQTVNKRVLQFLRERG